MSEDNGFVERDVPPRRSSHRGRAAALRQTAINGKAIVLRDRASVGGSYIRLFRHEGLAVRTAKRPDGTYIAWCERISEAKPSGAGA